MHLLQVTPIYDLNTLIKIKIYNCYKGENIATFNLFCCSKFGKLKKKLCILLEFIL